MFYVMLLRMRDAGISANAAGLGDDGESWTNDRRTMASMYDLYRTMTATEQSLPTARRLIRLYGPRFVGTDGPHSTLDSVLPAVLDVVLGSLDGHVTPFGPPRPSTTVFECSVETVVVLLREACPRIADARGALVNVHTRLVFAEWYRFVLLCVRDCRRMPGPKPLLRSPWTSANSDRFAEDG
uniref:Uncharacterized protein n=1 Tax=Sipha flava TaxID=143950 RepID=A0A2S2QR76_9HEMI